MFEIDVKRIEACISHKDYYSAAEYSMMVKEKYTEEKRLFFETIIKEVQSGEYEKIDKAFQKIYAFDNFQHNYFT